MKCSVSDASPRVSFLAMHHRRLRDVSATWRVPSNAPLNSGLSSISGPCSKARHSPRPPHELPHRRNASNWWKSHHPAFGGCRPGAGNRHRLLLHAGRQQRPAGTYGSSGYACTDWPSTLKAPSAVIEAAINAFQNQLRQLKEDAARDAGAPYTKDPRFNRLLTNAGAVLTAQSSLTDASSAARDTRTLVPKLLAEVSSVASGLSGPNLENATRALERFELRAQRLQLDVTALAAGAANPSQAAQRLAESADYLGPGYPGFDGYEPEPRSSPSDGCGRREAPEDTRHSVHGFERCCS